MMLRMPMFDVPQPFLDDPIDRGTVTAYYEGTKSGVPAAVAVVKHPGVGCGSRTEYKVIVRPVGDNSFGCGGSGSTTFFGAVEAENYVHGLE